LRARRILVASLILAALFAVARAGKPRGPDVHRLDGSCDACHTADAATLHQDPARAATLLVEDLEARCNGCHGDEGPSHKTGMSPGKTTPDALPLSGEGKVTCATCHFMHGESDAFDNFCRLDNRRGGLCLTCHELSELQ
jgi:hypothetical protein